MFPFSSSSLPFVCYSLLSLPLAAQQPAAPALTWPVDHVLCETAADGIIWAATAGWKAGFGPSGATFIPFLGSHLPSQPATFHLASAHLGTLELPLRSAAPVVAGQRISFDRGSIVELYDLQQDGIEQQFVLRERPAGGDLQLTIGVETELRAQGAAAGFDFVGDGGGIHYGAAVAIDAAGRRLPLPTTCHEGALHITVPAEFVASAALPLVVDPLLGSITAQPPSTAELRNTDLAYDHSLGQYYATYERVFSATDHDVYVVAYDAVMLPVTTLTIDFTSRSWTKPRVATLEAHDLGCVVAETSAGNTAPFDVRGRQFTTAPVALVQPVFIRSSTLGSSFDPDIAGDSDPTGPSRFLIVWEQYDIQVNDTGLTRVMLDAAGAFSYGTLLSTSIGFDRRPRISKTCGDVGGGTEGWVIVFRLELYQQTTGRLCALFIDRNGQQRWVNGPSYAHLTGLTPNAGSDWDVSSPTDHGEGRRFLCAETRVDPGTGRGVIKGYAFDRNGVLVGAEQDLASGALDYRTPAVACDGARFVLAHSVIFGATDHDVRVRALHLANQTLVQDEVAVPSTSIDRETALSVCAATGLPNTFGLAWVHTVGAAFVLENQRYLAQAPGGIVQRATGCGAMTMTALGAPRLGDLVSFGLPNLGGVQGFVAGLPVSVPVYGCVGCTQGVQGSTMLGTTLDVVIPQAAGLIGITLAVQGFHFAPSGAPCFGQLELSHTLDFTIR